MKKQCLSIRLLWAVIYHFQSINKIWINISLNVLLKSISQLTLLRNLYNESIFLYALNDLCALCWVLHVQGSWSSFNKVNHFIVSFRHFSFHLLSKFLNPEFICECVLWQYQHFFFFNNRRQVPPRANHLWGNVSKEFITIPPRQHYPNMKTKLQYTMTFLSSDRGL